MIYSVINQKGGAGKTTTALNLGYGLARQGYKVLFLDLDIQANLSALVNLDPVGSLVDVLQTRKSLRSLIVEADGVAIIPNIPGSDTDQVLQDPRHFRSQVKRLAKEYDYVIIDTPPTVGFSQFNALVVSDSCIIPVKLDYLSLYGLSQLAQMLEVAMSINHRLSVAGILVNQYQSRRMLNAAALEQLQSQAQALNTRIFKTFIRFSSLVMQSQAAQKSIFDYAKRSSVAKDYMRFIEELGGINDGR